MTRVAILGPGLHPGDAITNDTLGMRDVLEAKGHEVGLFAENWQSSAFPAKGPDEAAPFAGRDGLLVYHLSIGWELGLRILLEARCRRAVKYHNITPPEFFDAWLPDTAARCRSGRAEIGAIARAGCDLYLADSEFNARELAEAGADPARLSVVAPFHHVDRLAAIEPDDDLLRRFAGGPTVNVLSVGRLVPNKNHALLIEAFACYHRDDNPDSRLLLVGWHGGEANPYLAHCRRMVDAHWLRDAVVFTGPVSDEALKACYRAATVFVTTSEHEGFCVPVVEAMAMGVPVVALASSALPETLGNAGLLWPERDPDLFAGSIRLIASDAAARNALAARGLRRYKDVFSNQRTGERLVAALEPLLASGARGPFERP